MWETKEDSQNELVEVSFSEEDRRLAEEWGRNLGALRNSITNGRHNFYGRLGEIAVSRYVNGEIMDDYQYDVLTPDGEKLEVKTKVTTVKPKMHYECSVCQHNPHQRADKFVFVRVSSVENKAWICGAKNCRQFFEECTHHKKGDIDPRNNYTFHSSCFNMEIRCLDPL